MIHIIMLSQPKETLICLICFSTPYYLTRYINCKLTSASIWLNSLHSWLRRLALKRYSWIMTWHYTSNWNNVWVHFDRKLRKIVEVLTFKLTNLCYFSSPSIIFAPEVIAQVRTVEKDLLWLKTFEPVCFLQWQW